MRGIITSTGLYQPTYMPQGLCNSPATFQQCMDTISGDLIIYFVFVYLDYINVFSRTFNKHVAHLKKVFKRLAKANFKLKPKKCIYLKIMFFILLSFY